MAAAAAPTQHPWAVIDIEAASPPGGMHIVEIAVHRWQHTRELDRFETYIKPPIDLDGYACIGHHVRNDDVADAPVFGDVCDHILELLDGCIIVGHSVDNDIRMLERELSRLTNPASRQHLWDQIVQAPRYDTHQQWQMHQFCPRGRLKDLVAHFDVTSTQRRHTAGGDTEVTAKIAHLIAEQWPVALAEPTGRLRTPAASLRR